MIAMRSSVDGLAPFGAWAQRVRVRATAVAAAAVSSKSRRLIGCSSLLFREGERDRADRRLGIALRRRTAAPAAAASPVCDDDEVLASLRCKAHGDAARRPGEGPAPEDLPRVFVVGADLAVAA